MLDPCSGMLVMQIRWSFRLWLTLAAAALGTISANRSAGADTVTPPPTFSVAGGVFTNDIALSLTSKISNAVVRYTLDGSDPTAASSEWPGMLAITNSVLVRARTFISGLPPSAVASEHYTLLALDAIDFTSNLPLVILDSLGAEFERDRRRPAAMRMIDTTAGRASLAGAPAFEGRALINIRGRASLRYPKRSYTVKLLDEHDDFLQVPILGLPKESDWILYAPYPDKTFMRDVLAYELSNQIGEWAPRTRFVEVFVNETGGKLTRDDYAGLYVFEERVKRDDHRVNIAKLGPDDHHEPAITGGYIFKKDHVDRGYFGAPDLLGGGNAPGSSNDRPGFPTGPGGFPGDPAGFLPSYSGPRRSSSSSSSSSSSRSSSRKKSAAVTNHLGMAIKRKLTRSVRVIYVDDDERIEEEKEEGFRTAVTTNHLYFVDPEEDEITPVQRGWLKNHLNDFERALYGTAFRDRAIGYDTYIDAGSFIDHHLLVETTKNVDGFRFSTFFHKDRGGRIRAGPIWDWNLSFGNCNGKQGWMPEHWLWPQLDDKEYAWYRRLFEDPDFAQRYVDRWAELRKTVFATSRILARVDEIASLLRESQARNFEKWPILGQGVNPNWFVGETYEDEVKWMKEWIAKRLDWIERQFVPPPALAPDADEIKPGSKVKLITPIGSIYFTLDGLDSRAPGGRPSAKAERYDAPIRLKSGQQIFARTEHEGRWSSPLRMMP